MQCWAAEAFAMRVPLPSSAFLQRRGGEALAVAECGEVCMAELMAAEAVPIVPWLVGGGVSLAAVAESMGFIREADGFLDGGGERVEGFAVRVRNCVRVYWESALLGEAQADPVIVGADFEDQGVDFRRE